MGPSGGICETWAEPRCRSLHRLVLSEAEGRVEWIPPLASLGRDDRGQPAHAPKVCCGQGPSEGRVLEFGGRYGRERLAEVEDRGGRAFGHGEGGINPRGGESLHPGVLEFRLRFFGRSGLCDWIVGHESRCGIGDERRSEHIGLG